MQGQAGAGQAHAPQTRPALDHQPPRNGPRLVRGPHGLGQDVAVADRGGRFFRGRLAVQTVQAAPDAFALDAVPDCPSLFRAHVPKAGRVGDARRLQPDLHTRADAWIFRQRQVQQGTGQLVGAQHRQPGGLLHAAGGLGQEPRRRQPDRRPQTVADVLQDARLNPAGQGDGVRLQPFWTQQLAGTFVDRADLPHRHMPVDLGHDLLMDFDVEVGARLGDDQVGAQFARLGHPHPGMNAPGLTLIAGGDGAGVFAHRRPHDDRLAPPVRVHLLFDAGEEGVQIDEEPTEVRAVFYLSARLVHAGTYQEHWVRGSDHLFLSSFRAKRSEDPEPRAAFPLHDTA